MKPIQVITWGSLPNDRTPWKIISQSYLNLGHSQRCAKNVCKKAWKGRVWETSFAAWVLVMEKINILAHLIQGKVNIEIKVFSVQNSLHRRLCWDGVIMISVSSFFLAGLQLQHQRSLQSIMTTVPFAGTPCSLHVNSLAAISSTSRLLGLGGVELTIERKGCVGMSESYSRLTANQLLAKLGLLPAWARLVCF